MQKHNVMLLDTIPNLPRLNGPLGCPEPRQIELAMGMIYVMYGKVMTPVIRLSFRLIN